MNRKQFSIRYLLLEMLWIALSLGFALNAIRLPESYVHVKTYFAFVAIVFGGCAVGGLFFRMLAGGVICLFIVTVLLLLEITRGGIF